MKKSVQQLIQMINSGELHYNQSTQRRFVYADMQAQLGCGKTTKAGSLINAILEEGIQLPAVYFWDNTDTNQLNIHDGKQRILSLYYFINPTSNIRFTTWRNGHETEFIGLDEEDQNRLLNYEFDIVVRSGTSKEEERSFYLLNTNSVNLTSYECLSGMLHGTFLTELEKFIELKNKTTDFINPVGRGEQLFKFLLTMFNLSDSKKTMSNDKSLLLLSDYLRPIRNNQFIAEDFKLNEILDTFSDLMKAIKGLKEDRAIVIASYIVKNNYDADSIIAYYKSCMKQVNDISSWDIATHKTFIDAYINSMKLDPLRNFPKEVKDTLFSRCPRCAHVDEVGIRCSESSYSKLEVDHIIPWSLGGRTTIDNAQLLCKTHNTSKGNRGEN